MYNRQTSSGVADLRHLLFLGVSVLALGSAGILAAPNTATAFECVNRPTAAGADNAEDNGIATNTACGTNANTSAGGSSVAVGLTAVTVGGENTAVGAFTNAGSSVATDGNTALGFNAGATVGDGNIAIGSQSDADGGGAIAIGGDDEDNDFGAQAQAAQGIAIGSKANVETGSTGGVAIGETANVNNATPDGIAVGRASFVNGDFGVAMGQGTQALGTDSMALGHGAMAAGPGDISIGASGAVLSDNSTGMGMNHTINAGSSFSAAYGANTVVGANAPGAVAWGTDSAGNGAVATLENQFMLGTGNHTYTAPGITSDLSRARQSGPLEVVTSDANGNLATDGGQIFNQLDNQQRQINQLGDDVDRVESGVAVALSSVGPDLTGAEKFGLSLNWGGFEGASAIGGGATAVVWRGNGSRFALTGGIGVGFDEDAVGGRAGGQWTW